MEAIETPNTRSRRKRELDRDSEHGSGLSWIHDQGLRKAVLTATEHDHVELPTPTQKPRPISSRLANSPSSASNTPSSSRSNVSSLRSSRSRKRPCRHHRSLPEPSNLENGLGGSSSSSDSAGERLDALLARFALSVDFSPENIRPTPSASISIPMSKNKEGGSMVASASPLRALERNTLSAPSPLRRMTVSTDSIKSTMSTTTSIGAGLKGLERKGGSEIMRDSSQFRDHLLTNTPVKKRSLTPSSIRKASQDNTISTSPFSPHRNAGPAPRIGLRSSQTTKSTLPNNRNAHRPMDKPKTVNKPFKPPLLQPPTRSSPRRRSSDTTTIPRKEPRTPRTTLRDMSPLKQLTKDGEGSTAPSSDGPTTGDESFDSFDGLFVDGGPEIEELLRKVDGSQ